MSDTTINADVKCDFANCVMLICNVEIDGEVKTVGAHAHGGADDTTAQLIDLATRETLTRLRST